MPQMVTNPKNTITGFRNLLGRGFSDLITQDEIRNVPFIVEEKKDKTVGFRVSRYYITVRLQNTGSTEFRNPKALGCDARVKQWCY